MLKTKKAEINHHINTLSDNIVRRYGLDTKATVEWFTLANEFKGYGLGDNDPVAFVTMVDKTYYSFIQMVDTLSDLRMEMGD